MKTLEIYDLFWNAIKSSSTLTELEKAKFTALIGVTLNHKLDIDIALMRAEFEKETNKSK